MGAWDDRILNEDINVDFLDDLLDREDSEIIEAIHDACVAATSGGRLSTEEERNGLAAATVVAIWAGAPFSGGEIVENYPFIRELIGEGDEELREKAAELLENAEIEEDLDAYLEALS
ncbi:DUF4259 domain-containing protein [Corynebacterium kutscheri]|uniref:DUF4259 domain-containing protein n=1 Tax=Corynebacterium kutscheri TaxID=35755 RepID=A0AB38VPC4_9CORY|nr:DUF4259 domain-containing protein [Corynebacterium kutscheri]VEH04666.1 Uncharacterised protein [Corynebacterium kutscheri]